jgi:hypothetical protein
MPDGVTGIFLWDIPPGPTVELGFHSASNRNILWEVKVAGAKGLQPYQIHASIILKFGRLNVVEPSLPVLGLL